MALYLGCITYLGMCVSVVFYYVNTKNTSQNHTLKYVVHPT